MTTVWVGRKPANSIAEVSRPAGPRLDPLGPSPYDEEVMAPGTNARAGRPPCPTCDKPVAWAGNPDRPFCSLRCRLIDLGGWLDERYRLPGAPLSQSDLSPSSGKGRTAPDAPESEE